MTSVDFTAAQQRIQARQQLQEAGTQRNIRDSRALSRLPYPLTSLGQRGLETWDAIKGREGTRPAFRVGQVDAELLDEELLELLRGQVGEALKYFGVYIRDDWSAEILLALRAILFKLSFWDHNASYGATLQNLWYTDARHYGPLARAPSRWQKTFHGLLTVGGYYGWEKWENWLADQEGGYDEPSSHIRLLSRITSMASTTYSIAAFASFLAFLINGRYRTLLDRLLRLRLAPRMSQTSREVSFEYLNRQLVWHAFTEFLLFLLPLVGISRWRKWISRAWRKTLLLTRKGGETEESSKMKGQLAFLPERTCAICYQDQNPTTTSEIEVMAVSGASGGIVGSVQTDVTNPYETIPCGCVYCFVCIATRLESEEGEGWVCLRCGELVKECKPWAGDVLEEQSYSGAKRVIFSDEQVTREAQGENSKNPLRGLSSHNETAQTLSEHQIKSHWEESDSGIDVANG